MRKYRQDKEQNTDRQTPKKKRTKSSDNSGTNKKQPNYDICKSELRRSDRRAAMCVENIFFKVKKLQMKIFFQENHKQLYENVREAREL